MHDIVLDDCQSNSVGHTTQLIFEDYNCSLSTGYSCNDEKNRVVIVRFQKLNISIIGGNVFYSYLKEKAGRELTYKMPFNNLAVVILSYVFSQLAAKDDEKLLKVLCNLAEKKFRAGIEDGKREMQIQMQTLLGLQGN